MKYSNDSLRAHAYGRTRYSLSVETRTNALDQLEQAEKAERAKRSTACKFDIGAKACEGLVRDHEAGAGELAEVVGEEGRGVAQGVRVAAVGDDRRAGASVLRDDEGLGRRNAECRMQNAE